MLVKVYTLMEMKDERAAIAAIFHRTRLQISTTDGKYLLPTYGISKWNEHEIDVKIWWLFLYFDRMKKHCIG